MNRQEILDRLRENERALRERGVTHAALFGSRARGDNRPNSDTDIMIDIDPEADMSIYDYAGLQRYIASLFDGPVDVAIPPNTQTGQRLRLRGQGMQRRGGGRGDQYVRIKIVNPPSL